MVKSRPCTPLGSPNVQDVSIEALDILMFINCVA